MRLFVGVLMLLMAIAAHAQENCRTIVTGDGRVVVCCLTGTTWVCV